MDVDIALVPFERSKVAQGPHFQSFEEALTHNVESFRRRLIVEYRNHYKQDTQKDGTEQGSISIEELQLEIARLRAQLVAARQVSQMEALYLDVADEPSPDKVEKGSEDVVEQSMKTSPISPTSMTSGAGAEIPISPTSMTSGVDEKNKEIKVWSGWNCAQVKTTGESEGTKMKSEGTKSLMTQGSTVSDIRMVGHLNEYCVGLSPESNFNLFWQAAFVVVIFWELIMFPVNRSFKPESSGEILHMNWVVTIFWTMDCILNFFLGYYSKLTNSLILDPRRIALRYATSWMIPDLTVIMVDIFTLVGAQRRDAENLKVLRMARVAHLFRIFRLARLVLVFRTLDSFCNSAYFIATKTLMLNLFVILMIAHFVACLWYWVGVSSAGWGYERSWVNEYEGLADRTIWYKYSSALHFAVAQFTPGGINIHPTNTVERFFGVGMLVLGMVVFSTIVGNISQAVKSLRDITARYDKEFSVCRHWMTQNHFSTGLVSRVCMYADNMVKPKLLKFHMNEVGMLKILPKHLMLDIYFELRCRHVAIHPFFDYMVTHAKNDIRKVCRSLTTASLEKDEIHFETDEVCTDLEFLTAGNIIYQLSGSPDEALAAQFWDESNDPLCEIGLWTDWCYVGTLKAITHCELLALDNKTFRAIMTDSPRSLWLPQMYATTFVAGLNAMQLQGDTVTDLVRVEAAMKEVEDAEFGSRFSNLEKRQSCPWISKFQRFLAGAEILESNMAKQGLRSMVSMGKRAIETA